MKLTGQTGTILLVDPYADERDMYAESLRFAGFDVSVCATAAAVLAKTRTVPVLAVITRVRQSGDANGIALTERLKNDGDTRSIPVIVITSHIEANIRTAAHAAGCDGFLMIPCLPEQLISEIRRVVDDSQR